MKKNTAVWIVVILVVLIIIGVVVSMRNKNQAAPMIPADTSTSTTAGDTTAATPAATGTVVLNTGTSATLGSYLVASNGMTLYQSAADTSGVTNCTGQCATAWPPYTVANGTSVAVGAGISGTVSTIPRMDGTTQVTYNGMPLYFWQGDKASGDTTGQNVNGFTVVAP